MDNLIKKYHEEREGKLYLSNPHGFAFYKFEHDYCYITDIYVEPEFRKENIASKIADEITVIAKDKGYKFLVGSTDIRAKGHKVSMLSLLHYGFEAFRITDNSIIFYKKEI